MALLFLFGYLASLINSFKIGTNCSLGDDYCGSISDLEMLICDSTTFTCKGTYLNNGCDGTVVPCARNFYCSDVGICDKCPAGCDMCTKADSCSICLTGYYLQSGNCNPLPQNCMTGTSSTNCTACYGGYFLSNSTCNACPEECSTCTSAKDCSNCSTAKYWDTTENKCVNGSSNCITPINATACTQCYEGYYIYTDAQGVSTCVKGVEDCQCVFPLGTCQYCEYGYFLKSTVKSSCPLKNTDTNSCIQISLANCNSSLDGVTCATCNDGYFLTAYCYPQIKNCDVAADSNDCLTCSIGYYLKKGQCYPCYKSNMGGTIMQTCATCTGPYRANCTSCEEGYYMVPQTSYGCLPCAAGCTCSFPGECDLGCLIGYYANGATCAKCSDGCNQCTDNTECTVCETGYYLKNAQCLVCQKECSLCTEANVCGICSTGFYLTNGKCSICPSSCSSCTALNACTACLSGFYLGSGSCTQCGGGCTCAAAGGCTGCVDGFYFANNVCTACVTGCKLCNSTTCTACLTGYSLVNNACLKCGVNCPNCTVNLTGKCDYCNDGYIIRLDYTGCDSNPSICDVVEYWPDQCKKCADGFALSDKVAYQQPCQNCDSHCKTCTAALPHNCSECIEGFYVDEFNVCNLTCNSNCAVCANSVVCKVCKPYYYLVNGICQAIPDPNCVVSSDGKTCTKCAPEYVFVPQNFTCIQCNYSDESAVATCSPPPLNSTGQLMKFAVLSPLTCLPGSFKVQNCSFRVPGCDVLATPNICSVCSPKYVNATSDTGVCFPCNSNCTSCSAGSYIDNGNCVACTTGCATCVSAGNCTLCSPGYKFVAWNCIACTVNNTALQCNCPSGQYWNVSCVPCITGCSSCNTSVDCLTCKPKYYLDNKLCIRSGDSNCRVVYAGTPNSKGQATGVCQSCIPTSFYDTNNRICIACTTQAFCQACIAPKICAACVTGYYLENNANCTKCPANLTNCNACSNATTCDICAVGYWWNQTYPTRNCTACPATCETCSDMSSCLTCQRGYFLSGKSCLPCPSGCSFCTNSTNCTTCDSKSYLDPGTYNCTPCHPLCASCNYTGISNCTGCITNSTLTNAKNGVGTCVCMSGTSLSEVTNTCLDPENAEKAKKQFLAEATYPAYGSYLVTGVITFGIILFFIL